VVYVELPEVGQELEEDSKLLLWFIQFQWLKVLHFSLGVFGVLESVKAASDLYSPLSGTVVDVNSKLSDSPELINEKPYTEGV